MKLLEENRIEDIKKGMVHCEETGEYVCLECGAVFCEGEVYPMDGRFFEAGKAAEKHVQASHGGRLEALLSSGSKYISLTEHQKKLLLLLNEGKTDAEIAAQSGTAGATVRRQRFMFREKAKQARMYLAIYGLLEGAINPSQESRDAAKEGEIMIAGRFDMTQKEYDQYIQTAFSSTNPLQLRAVPAKAKKRAAVIDRIAQQFSQGTEYTEKEVNEILKNVHPEEYVVLRRYLIEHGYMSRERDGSRYWMC